MVFLRQALSDISSGCSVAAVESFASVPDAQIAIALSNFLYSSEVVPHCNEKEPLQLMGLRTQLSECSSNRRAAVGQPDSQLGT